MNSINIPSAKKQIFLKKLKVIALTWLFAGTLDILSAIIDSSIRYKINPAELFQYIASGVFGQASFSGGFIMAAYGLFFHYLIAGCWTVLFFLIYPKLNIPRKFKIISGFIYGIFIWIIMNLIVVPMSNTRKMPFHLGHAVMGMLYIILMIGIPVSLIYHKFYRSNI